MMGKFNSLGSWILGGILVTQSTFALGQFDRQNGNNHLGRRSVDCAENSSPTQTLGTPPPGSVPPIVSAPVSPYAGSGSTQTNPSTSPIVSNQIPDQTQLPIQDSFSNQPSFANTPSQTAAASAGMRSNQPSANSFASASRMGGGDDAGWRDTTIGDFFGGGGAVFGGTWGLGVNNAGSMAISGGDRRFKLTEQTNPLPMNRVFFNYNHFANPIRDIRGQDRDIDRYTFGLERLIGSGMGSLELRVPVVAGLSSVQDASQTSFGGTQLGNITLTPKLLLTQTNSMTLSTGVGVNLPTADGATYFAPGQTTPTLTVSNNAVHLLPFLGLMINPNCRNWMIFYAQADFDANGNRTQSFDPLLNQFNAQQRYNDQHLLFLDASFGHWFFRNNRRVFLRGIAGIAELHYTTALNNSDRVLAGALQNGDFYTNPFNRQDFLNATGGCRFQLGRASTLTAGVVTPLMSDTQKPFDSEVVIQLNRRY